MTIKSIFNLYSIIFLCVIVSALSIFVYVRHQNGTKQTAEVKYNTLTESEKAIVEKNIKNIIAQQKQKRIFEEQEQKKDTRQQTAVDETNRNNSEFNSRDVDAQYANKRREYIKAQSNEVETKKTKQPQEQPRSMNTHSTAKIPSGLNFDPRDPSTLPHLQNIPQGGREFKVNSKEELQKLLVEWEHGDDPKLKKMAENLKQNLNNMGENADDVKIVIHVAE